jgi:spermidine synthase
LGSSSTLRSRAILFLFFLSGASGLVYQVVWIRHFVHIFGATVLAVSTVLAAFMGGLAFGGLAGGRAVRRFQRPLAVYGILEILLALYAVCVPLLLEAVTPLYASVYPRLESSFAALSLVRFVVSGFLLLPPTFLMGATLPLLTAQAEREGRLAHTRVAHLYAVNTYGAAFGTALASFFLLPSLGLSTTLLAGVAANLIVGVCAILLSRRGGAAERESGAEHDSRAHHDSRAEHENAAESEPGAFHRFALLATVGVLGFSALAFEVLWTRALSLALGTTTYAFAIVLTVFLLGIATGSAAAGRILARTSIARIALPATAPTSKTLRGVSVLFAGFPAAIGLLALGLLPLFDHLPGLFLELTSRGQGTWVEGLLAKFLVAGLPLFLPTFLSGAAFPIAVGIDRSSAAASRSVGDLYASNTLGAILGSWTAGFVIIPKAGLRFGIEIAAALLIAATIALLFVWRTRDVRPRLVAVGLALLATILVLALPDWNRAAMTRGGFARGVDLRRHGQNELAEDAAELVYFRDGISTTVTVRRFAGELTMQMNGITEASTSGDLATQVFVGGFGGILHRDPRDVLVIGLGSGITAAAAARHPGVQTVECVEISEAVVDAARLFDAWNHRVLEDPRFRIIIGDGRNHLRLSGRTYDVIVSQPSNVWNSGIGSLMSREFYRFAREHLRDEGILVSWIQGYSLTPGALRAVLAAVRESFPNVSLWMADWGDLVIVAGLDSFKVDVERVRAKSAQHDEIRSMLLETDSPDMLSLLSHNLIAGSFLDRYVAGAAPNTDDNLYLEFAAPKFLYRETMPELFASFASAAGGTEEIVANAPEDLKAALRRARDARRLESQAMLAFRANRGEEGLLAIEEAYRLHPSAASIAEVYARALSGKGESLAHRDDLPGAMALYLRAAEIDPDFGEPLANVARVYQRSGDISTALQAVAEAIHREPRHPGHRALEAALLVQSRDFEGARRAALASLNLDPRGHDAHLALGQSLEGLGRFEEAESTFTAGLAFHADSENLRAHRQKLARKR